jgi:hypothetical protein
MELFLGLRFEFEWNNDWKGNLVWDVLSVEVSQNDLCFKRATSFRMAYWA